MSEAINVLRHNWILLSGIQQSWERENWAFACLPLSKTLKPKKMPTPCVPCVPMDQYKCQAISLEGAPSIKGRESEEWKSGPRIWGKLSSRSPFPFPGRSPLVGDFYPRSPLKLPRNESSGIRNARCEECDSSGGPEITPATAFRNCLVILTVC